MNWPLLKGAFNRSIIGVLNHVDLKLSLLYCRGLGSAYFSYPGVFNTNSVFGYLMKTIIQTAYWLLIIVSCAALSHLRQPVTDMLSNFYIHYSLAGALLFFAALHWRLPRTAIVSLAITAITFGLAFSFERVPLVPEAQLADGTKTYRIMTFNAWEQAKTMNQLKTYLRQEKPDFVILQEITLKDWRSLKEIKDLYPHSSYCDDWLCGIAFLSRHKWRTIKAQNFGPHNLPMIRVKFPDSLKGLTVYAIHSARPHWKYSTQREQFEHLSIYLKENSRSPVVLAGDMNASAFSSLLKDFAATSSLTPVGGLIATWPQRLRQMGYLRLPILQLDIDHFFVKPEMTILRLWRGPDLGSDHRPLLMELAL